MPLLDLFHHRSLTLSLSALLLSLVAAGHVVGLGFAFSMKMGPPTAAFTIRTIVFWVLAAAVAVRSTLNLIRDVERGYSPSRCTLAAVVLFFAFAMLVWLALGLTGFVLDNR